jgi:hypothetical protein
VCPSQTRADRYGWDGAFRCKWPLASFPCYLRERERLDLIFSSAARLKALCTVEVGCSWRGSVQCQNACNDWPQRHPQLRPKETRQKESPHEAVGGAKQECYQPFHVSSPVPTAERVIHVLVDRRQLGRLRRAASNCHKLLRTKSAVVNVMVKKVYRRCAARSDRGLVDQSGHRSWSRRGDLS